MSIEEGTVGPGPAPDERRRIGGGVVGASAGSPARLDGRSVLPRVAPAAAAMETQCLRFIAEFVGYPKEAGGLLVSGGAVANFTAVLTALRHAAPDDSAPDGLQAAAPRGRFLLYTADHEGHVSVTRVAGMLNLGRQAVRLVPSRADFTMDPRALDRMLEEDRRRGDVPFCVVAQLGSANVGAVDPIGELADVCARHGVWLHGDGACGMLAAGLAETGGQFRGLERADSVAVDTHEWLGVPQDCGVVLVRQRERLRRAFSIAAPQLGEGREGQGAMEYRELGSQMSQALRAFKVWMVLQSVGAAGLREVLSNSLRLARHLHALVGGHPDFEVLHEPALYVYSFRYVPNALTGRPRSPELEARVDRLNEAIALGISRSGLARLVTTRLRGRLALRMSICSHRTLERDVEAIFEALARLGRRLAAEAGLCEAWGEPVPLVVANP